MTKSEAVREFKRLRPILDAVKPDRKTYDEACKVLAAHMNAEGITEYRGIRMREVGFACWEDAKLRQFLGSKVEQFRGKSIRRYFDLVKPARS